MAANSFSTHKRREREKEGGKHGGGRELTEKNPSHWNTSLHKKPISMCRFFSFHCLLEEHAIGDQKAQQEEMQGFPNENNHYPN